MHQGTIAANLGIEVASSSGVDTYQTAAAGAVAGLLGEADVFVEGNVEFVHHFAPLLLAGGDIVEVLFDRGCEVVVYDVSKVLHQECVDHASDVGGEQLALLGTYLLDAVLDVHGVVLEDNGSAFHRLGLAVFLDYIFALEDGADSRCVCGRTSDTQFFQFLDKARFGIAGRMLGVVLQSLCHIEVEVHTLYHLGQGALGIAGVFGIAATVELALVNYYAKTLFGQKAGLLVNTALWLLYDIRVLDISSATAQAIMCVLTATAMARLKGKAK